MSNSFLFANGKVTPSPAHTAQMVPSHTSQPFVPSLSASSVAILQMQQALGNQKTLQLMNRSSSSAWKRKNENALIYGGQHAKMIQRVKNETGEVKFFPLVPYILTQDEDHYYLFHGTFATNLDGIGKGGLDPAYGGSDRGARQYEQVVSKDAKDLMKYATDPNIAMIYAKAPAEQGAIGAFLVVRVARSALDAAFSERDGEKDFFWRRERGGENHRRIDGVPPNKLALNGKGEQGEHDHILALETNIVINPENIFLAGLYLPPHGEVNEEELAAKLEVNTKEESQSSD
ncbi:hypothetical protein [Paenibacillus campi]|uniref:hypothetical protein n=1 Tax=Paenibacillus campi TaxID=3106031 RepID=UPI002AFFFA3C|nr:hypothetical protein [Paenibacillus sp. SGZ-1009]